MDTIGNDLSSGGQVLSQEELVEKRLRSGQCTKCGAKCFKKKLFKLEPITEPGLVLNGRCLTCNPQDPTKGEELIAACAPAVMAPPPAWRRLLACLLAPFQSPVGPPNRPSGAIRAAGPKRPT